MPSFRNQLAELWHEGSKLTRKDIFGPSDELRPEYENHRLNWQTDVVAVGMVGKNYKPDGLILLSVNPAGGKEEFSSDDLSDKVYERYRGLQNTSNSLRRFEDSNKALLASIPGWRITTQYYYKILEAAGKHLIDVSFLYVVPFRTRCDNGSSMKSTYLDNGYAKHLRMQLDALSPGNIIAMDRPSEKAALAYKKDSESKMRVIYFTRKHDAHFERKETLRTIRGEFQ